LVGYDTLFLQAGKGEKKERKNPGIDDDDDGNDVGTARVLLQG